MKMSMPVCVLAKRVARSDADAFRLIACPVEAGTRIYAIDLASGVESSPGVKDHDKLRRLFERIRR